MMLASARNFWVATHRLPPKMTASYRQSSDQVVVRMHDALVVDEIVEKPQNLRNFVVLCLFCVGCDAHLQVHLLLQSLGVKFIEKARLLI